MHENANPLLKRSTLPYQAPAFDQIEDEHYLPAFEKGIEQQTAQIKAIAESQEQPTFDNTLVALEKSGEILNRVTSIFFAVANANTNEYLQEVEEESGPEIGCAKRCGLFE
ncbi:hypothetical protein [Paracnuella aquatica]